MSYDYCYSGFTVHGFTPPVAPNPSCCSNPSVLCPKCAAEALRRAGIARNRLVANFDKDDYLPLPVMNFERSPVGDEDEANEQREDNRQRPALVHNGVMADGDDPSMIPPTIVWGEDAKPRCRCRAAKDYLPLPGMTY